MKVPFIILSVLLITACNSKSNRPVQKQMALTPLQMLEQRKAAINNYLEKDSSNLTVMVKLINKNDLIKIEKNDWPDSVEYTLNILKDKTGKIVMIAQMPFSESGDWEISYRHYFDQNGRTFLFSKEESTFDNSVAGDIVRQTLTRYYNHSFAVIARTNKLTDVNGRPVNRKTTDFNFSNDEFKIYRNLKECLLGYHLLKH